jgi:acetyl-CoA acetyltransferase
LAEAFIIDAVRSPTGKRKGSLADVHAADLGAHVTNGRYGLQTMCEAGGQANVTIIERL